MKICMVDPQSYSNLQSYDNEILSRLEYDDVSLIGNIKFNIQNVDYDVIKIYKYSDKKGMKKILSYLYSQIRLYLIINQKKPDIVHFQWFKIPLFDVLLIKFIKIFFHDVRVIHTAHNILPHDTGEKYYNLYFKIYKSVDMIVCHTEPTKRELIERFDINEHKIKVIPHGLLSLNCEEKEINNEANELSSKYNLKDKTVVSCLGALNRYKGIDLVEKAWLKLQNLQENKDIILIVAGKGKDELMEGLRNLNNVVIINRYLRDAEFEALLRVTDVMLLPYRRISQSGVLLSAIKNSIPVVVSNIGGLVEPFKIGKIGWILDGINAQSLLKILQGIILDKTEMISIKNNCELWQNVKHYYDWGTISKMTSDMYECLLADIQK